MIVAVIRDASTFVRPCHSSRGMHVFRYSIGHREGYSAWRTHENIFKGERSAGNRVGMRSHSRTIRESIRYDGERTLVCNFDFSGFIFGCSDI